MDWKNETWHSLGRFCGKQFPPTITTSGESMKILFRSNSANQGDGFRVKNDFLFFALVHWFKKMAIMMSDAMESWLRWRIWRSNWFDYIAQLSDELRRQPCLQLHHNCFCRYVHHCSVHRQVSNRIPSALHLRSTGGLPRQQFIIRSTGSLLRITKSKSDRKSQEFVYAVPHGRLHEWIRIQNQLH